MSSFNESGLLVNDALMAHDFYCENISDWYDWLEQGGEESNALKFVLNGLINDAIERRKSNGQCMPSGPWSELTEDEFPTADQIIGYQNGYRSLKFDRQVRSKKDNIENAAKLLIPILEDNDFLAEIDELPKDEQIEIADCLLEQLHISIEGLKYLSTSLQIGAVSPLPLYHPDRFLNNDDLYWEMDATLIARRVGKVLASYYLKLLPSVMITSNTEMFMRGVTRFLDKYLPEDLAVRLGLSSAAENDREFTRALQELREELKNDRAFVSKYGSRTVFSLLLIVEVANIAIAGYRIAEDPSTRNYAGLFHALTLGRMAVSDLAENFKYSRWVLPGARYTLLAVFTTAYDLITSTVDFSKALSDNDLTVAFGYLTRSVGFAAAGTAIILKIFLASSIFNPVLGLIALAATVTILAGEIIVHTTEDTKWDQWFTENYFGDEWENVSIDQPPETNEFMWRMPDGKANLVRQISDYLSKLYPLNMTVTYDGLRVLRVKINPTFASRNARIIIYRIIDINAPEKFARSAIYDSAGYLVDEAIQVGTNSIIPEAPQENGTLEEWCRTMTIFDLQVVAPDWNPKGSWIEIEVSVPDSLKQFMGEMNEVDHILNDTPFVLRSRKQIPG